MTVQKVLMTSQKRVVFIASMGGHLNELLQLSPIFEKTNYTIITEKSPSTLYLTEKYQDKIHYLVSGSREHLFVYLFKFTYNALLSLIYVLRFRPQSVVSTGTHTAVVFCYLAKILLGSKIIYIETYANVKLANISGKLIHPIADLYLVQWESLLPVYKKAQYVGKLY